MLLKAFLAITFFSLFPIAELSAIGSDWPEGTDRAAMQGGFVAELNARQGFLPKPLAAFSAEEQANHPREVLVMLKSMETLLFDDNQLPHATDWQSVEQSLVILPDVHLFRWYHHFYKAIALAEAQAYQLAKIEGERALSQALALRTDEQQLASFGMLSVLAKSSGDYQEALRYIELFHMHQVKAGEKATSAAHQTSPDVVKKSNSKSFYTWIVFGLAILFGLGWYWLPFKLVWLPAPFGGGAANAGPSTMMPWVNKADSLEEENALTDEEIVVDEAKVELLARLRTHKLVTNDDWLAFQQLFIRIHPDFLIHLRFKHKGITPAEEKLACLIRVHFSTREIARLLAVSVNSVNISRYRLRKRCKIEGNTTLEEYLMRY